MTKSGYKTLEEFKKILNEMTIKNIETLRNRIRHEKGIMHNQNYKNEYSEKV